MSESFIMPDWPAPPNVNAMITTREGGVSKPPYDSFNLGLHVEDSGQAVRENRNRLMQGNGIGVFQWLRQVHGNDVLTADDGTVEATPSADAVYTRERDIACGVLTADCLSVFFCDEDGKEVAVAHAGWRGLAAGVLERTLEKFSAAPANIMAYLGPVIGPCHFEVGEEVRQAFLNLDIQEIRNQDAILFLQSESPDKWMGDLFAIARIILASRGIKQICGEPICTYCEFDRFYSYRRDGKTGRFASLIWRA